MLEAVPGVVNARVNPAASCVTVRHDGGEAVRARVLAMVEDIPGEAFLPGHGRARPLALPTVVGQGLAAAATPFLPSSVAAPWAWPWDCPPSPREWARCSPRA
jgi:Cu2+-exporting ATPase